MPTGKPQGSALHRPGMVCLPLPSPRVMGREVWGGTSAPRWGSVWVAMPGGAGEWLRGSACLGTGGGELCNRVIVRLSVSGFRQEILLWSILWVSPVPADGWDLLGSGMCCLWLRGRGAAAPQLCAALQLLLASFRQY